MAKRQRILQGCPNCQLCTGHTFTGMGRNIGRATATVSTLGIAALARKICKACEHPMSEHQTARVQVAAPRPPMQPIRQGPPTRPPGWYADPTDQRAMCWWDGIGWRPETKHYPAQ